MTEAQAFEAIYEAWLATWPSLHSDIPTALGNEEFTPPAAPASWCRVTVRHTAAAQMTMGLTNRQWERRGRIVVQLFGDVNAGDALLAGLADDARSILEGTRMSVGSDDYVQTYAGTTSEGMSAGSGDKATDGRWAMKLVTIPFFYRQQR